MNNVPFILIGKINAKSVDFSLANTSRETAPLANHFSIGYRDPLPRGGGVAGWQGAYPSLGMDGPPPP